MPIKKYLLKIIYYLLINFTLFSIIGAFLYKIYKLNNFTILLTIALSQIIIFIIPYFSKKFNINLNNYLNFETQKINGFSFENKIIQNFLKKYVLLFVYVIIFLIEIIILINSQTSDAIISPWEKINFPFLLLYTILGFIIILNIYFKKKYSLILIILHAFLSFSLIAIIYKIGYGFDYFIHNTSLDLIKKKGILDPKPFYYLGHYALIIILNKITLIPISILNKFLVPVLASLYIPLLLFRANREWLKNQKLFLFSILGLLIIPFSFLTLSNPQNLAYLYLIFAILIGFVSKNYLDLFLLYLFALASLSVHPLAGISALFYAFLITIYHSDLKFKKNLYRIVLILNSASLPLAFMFFGNGNQVSAIAETSTQKQNLLQNFYSFFKFINPNSENLILNFLYLYIFNLKFLLILIIGLGIFTAYKHKKECSLIFLNFFMAVSLLASFFILKNMQFYYLISYEQDDFSNRILSLVLIFLLPFFILSFYKFTEKLLKQNNIIKYIFFILLSVAFTFSLYASYPRLDHYHNSHGYSVSEVDLKASLWINNDSEKDYIVLANQQVSAAALSQFGFKKYFKNNIFYYPIPTGGELYQYYLKMVYEKPDKKTALEAANLVGVKTVYFVINKYWWASSKIIEEARMEADSFQKIDDGEIYIFKYLFK